MQVTDSDAQLQLKKRARRRLVGAVAFVTFAAIVLPMVMDQAPPPPTPDVQIRIPGQDQATPQFPSAPARPAPAPRAEAAPVPPSEPAAAPQPAEPRPADKAPAKPAERTADKAAEKAAADKAAADKAAAEKAAAEKARAEAEAKRAAALLGGGKAEARHDKPADKPAAAAPAAAGGQHVILIGAFANPGNVKNLQAKLGEIGLKTYTEPLESPQGVKTRVRAGPFPSREAAEKALEKMKKIGVNGIVSAK